VLSFAFFSLHEQRKEGRRRAVSGILAVQASPQAIQQQDDDSTGDRP